MNTTNNTTDVAKNNCNVLLSSIKLLQRSLFGLSSNFWIFEKFRLSSLFWAFGLRLLQLILLNNTTNVAKSDILTIYCHPLKGKIIPFPDLGFFCNKKSQLFWKSCNFLIFWSWIEKFISRNTYCSRSLHFRGLSIRRDMIFWKYWFFRKCRLGWVPPNPLRQLERPLKWRDLEQ